MPLYEYYCPPCGIQFEILRPMSQMDHVATCPSGHTTNNRVLSVFAPLPRSGSFASDVATMQAGADDCCMTEGGPGCSCC